MKNLRVAFVVCLSAIVVGFSACGSAGNTSGKTKYKARFEVAGICSNYTFSVIEGNIDTSQVVAEWKDPQTGELYKNAFAVANPCLLPQGLKKGDTFYFVIDEDPPKNECAVCLAYYPTPEKRLNIKIVQ